jgi:tRNA(fMet)-specific endonuclease VapC
MVCVDTSFIVAIERRQCGALKKLQGLADRGEVVYTTAVSVAECYRGAYGSKDKARALRDVKELLDLFVILNLDHDSGRIWGELAESTKSYMIGDRDLFIASIVLANGQPLVTNNKKHFERVPGLLLEDWQ